MTIIRMRELTSLRRVMLSARLPYLLNRGGQAVPMFFIGTPACRTGRESKHVVCVVIDTLRLRSQKAFTALRVTSLILMLLVFFIGCNDMYDTGRIKPLEKSNFFTDGSSARPLPQGTVPRGYASNTDVLHTGKVNGKLADLFPFAVTDSVIQRGRNRYTTFCTPCHGRLGDGGGMIVQRGFPRPNSFHTDSLRARPAGYFFDVMTNGFGKMYSYAPSIPVDDRWAIVAYVRALQLSQRASVALLPDSDKKELSK